MNSRRSLAGVALALSGLAAVSLGCAEPAAPHRPDLILVSVDTLRADLLGCYGAESGATPELDRFCARAARFRTTVSHAPATLASHASLFTSRLPQHHGAAFAARRAIPDSELTVAEALSDAGYRTVAFTAGGQLQRRFGVDQGFESFRAQWERSEPGAFERKVDRALRVLDDPDGRPLFLFLHTYEVHLPYTPEPGLLARADPGYDGELGDRIEYRTIVEINDGKRPISPRDLRHVAAAQEAELTSVDRAFGRLARAVAARQSKRPTIVMFTSDHGEELGEHGRLAWHGHTLYDELLLVPWIVSLPDGEAAGLEIELPVRGIDLAPTLLELAGVDVPAEFEGRSVAPLLRGGALDELPAVFERSRLGDHDGPLDGIRWRRWKLHDDRLFDLRADPGETIDRSADAARTREELERTLAELVASAVRAKEQRLEVDAEAESQLKALGYLQ